MIDTKRIGTGPLWAIADYHPPAIEAGQSTRFESRCHDEAIPTNIPLPQSVLGLAWCAFSTEQLNRPIARSYWLRARTIAHNHLGLNPIDRPTHAVAAE